jgi:uncharacterized protein YdiU (UPF0061 family)
MSQPSSACVPTGNARFRESAPTAARYAGHQFGSYVSQLGDGRAISLGELENARGERWEWQLKGAGKTPFSRFGDGRAVLRSTVREFLCSEAMHALGIPTTRALAIVGSDEPVIREEIETAAVLSRVARSFVRFGSFEVFHHRRMTAEVKTLADYTIDRFFPESAAQNVDDRYPHFLKAVVERTARTIAQWQSVGFAHGVMNTDNMSILGDTIDYGPFGFLDAYDPEFICNHTDAGGRYAFFRQPSVGLWNCSMLAVALGSLVTAADAQVALDAYAPAFHRAYESIVRAKFGLTETRDGDIALITEALSLMAAGAVDFTIFFRRLSSLPSAAGSAHGDAIAGMFANRDAWYSWVAGYRARLAAEKSVDGERHTAMANVNPKFVLRNYLAQRAIEAAEERDFSEIQRLAAILRTPFDEHPQDESYAALPPQWAAAISVSCSS